MRIPYPPALRNLVYRLYARRVEGRLDHTQVPKHIGVILDGNRRWARADGRT
ncbi:isoprenyl transferase, partial [Streptomyces exfoliatus]